MPQRINKEKSDISVSLGAKLRMDLVEACAEDEKSLSQAVKEAVANWLAARNRKRKRKASDGKSGPA